MPSKFKHWFVGVVFFVASSLLTVRLEAYDGSCSALGEAKSFSFGTKVTAGTVLSGKRSFSGVLHRTDAVACLESIIDTGNNQGKMYALAGLRELNRPRFNVYLKRLERQDFSVVMLATAQQGVLATDRARTVLQRIKEGAYRKGVEFCRTHRVLVD
jgi:hypothetical protein